MGKGKLCISFDSFFISLNFFMRKGGLCMLRKGNGCCACCANERMTELNALLGIRECGNAEVALWCVFFVVVTRACLCDEADLVVAMHRATKAACALHVVPHIVRPPSQRRHRRVALCSADAPARLSYEQFDDEESVLRHLGMFGHLGAREDGFAGQFRQHWDDFHVTEIDEGSERVSRVWDDTLPDMPEDGAANILECTLHKQHVPHPLAMQLISKALVIHPTKITFAGIKDFIGDTVQRVRIAGVSPASARSVTSVFLRGLLPDAHMQLHNFRYVDTPFRPGDLWGNHFRIVLKDVSASPDVLERAIRGFRTHGFANFYGCQRFSWFAGKEDASLAWLQGDTISFAFRLLDFVSQRHSLRELLERKLCYPLPFVDSFRRSVIANLRSCGIKPDDLSREPFLQAPPTFGDVANNVKLNTLCQKVSDCLSASLLSLQGSGRRLTLQRFSNYMWNQALSLRLKNFGDAVLVGDFVIPSQFRSAENRELRMELCAKYCDVVTARQQTQLPDIGCRAPRLYFQWPSVTR